MRKLFYSVLMAATIVACGKKEAKETVSEEVKEEVVEVVKDSTAAPAIKWNATKVTGEHFGTVAIKSVDIEMEEGKLAGGTVEVDMTSIDVTDLEGEWKDKLVGHLKSPDFFAVDSFPVSVLEIKTVSETEAGYDVVADLTIKGITNPVEFAATVADNVFTTSFKVDRTLYDIKYKSAKFFAEIGDKAIHDEFTLEVSLELE